MQWERKDDIISLALLVRLSTIVKSIPSIFSFGLIVRFTFEMERISKSNPFDDR